MSDVKQVKVDNWGIYFLQRLKHFFNRTDYCDLTLQFQDNAQLKVHRLVLNACTEYFELLERTCEMYEDCLVMPDDLQADVVVPIINFMYTGQLEFKMDSLEKLYQTSLVMNMPVLTKLLEAHRNMQCKPSSQSYSGMKKNVKSSELLKSTKYSSNLSSLGKRSYNKAFESYKTHQKVAETNKSNVSKSSDITKSKLQNNNKIIFKDKKYITTRNQLETSVISNNGTYRVPSPPPLDTELYVKKLVLGDPRPTRYELPEELDTDNIFENSFSKLSYTSTPLMVHPDSTKQYSKKNNIFVGASGSKKDMKSTVDIVECKKVSKNESLFEDGIQGDHDEEMFQSAYLSATDESARDPNQLFDQMLDGNGGPKVTIEGKDKQSGSLDHVKIISEVLKKYPHLVKGNKNIKLKILNSSTPTKTKKTAQVEEKIVLKPKTEVCYTYETDVMDSKEAAKLIAMGAENIKGPWICLICGTPGRALNFTSYYNYRRHLVEVHNEKPVSTICEYCGLRSFKRNYLLHHIYTKHGVPPPPQYHFPKCNMCDYVALTEAFLVKHKLNHSDSKTIRCYVCSVGFSSTSQLLMHVQKTGHQYNKDKKPNLQCVYCMKVFLRESNFYVHLKTSHREAAIKDGIIEDSDDERQVEEVKPKVIHDVKSDIKYEHSFENDFEDADLQYPLHQKTDSNIKKPVIPTSNAKHKILNPGFKSHSLKSPVKPKVATTVSSVYSQDVNSLSPSPQISEENIVLIDGDEYIMKENQLIPKKPSENTEYILSDIVDSEVDPKLQNLEASLTPTTSIEFANIDDTDKTIQQPKMVVKKATNMNQPIQIVVSNEEEYKALMASNHSIIFDDGDSSKTLTVLTAPHTNAIDSATIDLQNSQSSDMMIIQQDYPLNVTEAVSAVSADSKYVVVYSHAVGHDDPSKQYQIITPQDIGAEFVQASEVITQNYETVTTTTSVLDTHVIEPQIEEQWPEQNTDVQVIEHMEHEHEIIESDKIEQNVIDPTMTIVDIPEVHLPVSDVSIQDDSVTLQAIPQNIIQNDSIDMEDIQNNVSQEIDEDIQNNVNQEIEIQNNTPEAMEVDVPAELVIEDKLTTEGPEINQMLTEEMTQSDVNIPQNDNFSAQTTSEILVATQDTQEMVEETNEPHDNVEQSTDVIDEVNTEELTDAVEVNNSVPKAAEQIQNIASEWSEDESDLGAEGPVEAKTPAAETQVQFTEESEVEESIENIQQEMQNQLSSVADEVPVTEEFINTEESHLGSPNDTDACNQNELQSEVPNDNIITTQVKLSSLLNDWEDNDSQEENTPTNENENIPVEKDTIVESVEVQTESKENNDVQMSDDIMNSNNSEPDKISNTEPKKDDNIKNLVSDWDDEEEETKE